MEATIDHSSTYDWSYLICLMKCEIELILYVINNLLVFDLNQVVIWKQLVVKDYGVPILLANMALWPFW